MIKVIAGLGNPGKKYKDTRHNVGFWVIDKIGELKELGTPAHDPRFEAEILKIEGVYLLKPLTFMNLVGRTISNFLNYFKITPDELLIVLDDIDQSLGQIRFRFSGSSGGHKGLQSIIQKIGPDFWRAKIGIGRDPKIPTEKYVLQKPTPQEKKELQLAVDKLANYLLELIDKKQNPEQKTF